MAESLSRIQELMGAKSWLALKQELNGLEPFNIAELIEKLPQPDRAILFRLLPRGVAAEVFSHLPHSGRREIAHRLAEKRSELADLLNDLEPDDRTAFFEELPGEVIQRLVQLLSRAEREIATSLLGYPKDSIGRLMTPEYVAVKPQATAREALEHIRRFGQDSETLDVVYVVDNDWKLLDDLRIREIILAPPDRLVSELSDSRPLVALDAHADQETAVKVFQDHDRIALPVTDSQGVLLGIVTFDDVMDVAQREQTEDFHKFGGAETLDLSYTRTPLFSLVRKRAGWLIILFLSEMLTATAMGHFEEEISKAVVLALFIPLIISSGGNSGSQAASLIIRSLALEELKLRNWFTVFCKEALSGLLLGSVLGVIGFIRILVWQHGGFYDYGEYWASVGLSVALALVFVVLWGTISGSMIPFLLKACGLDPATASAPFVATLVDVTGLIIYFSVAALFLTGKLL
ncbi:MAG: magnesium transporter [Candidatus Adiutrix sp.]|jgi:magnesium transporter|nr:magnesium transporter [Candidatus Adiutrix sp.]